MRLKRLHFLTVAICALLIASASAQQRRETHQTRAVHLSVEVESGQTLGTATFNGEDELLGMRAFLPNGITSSAASFEIIDPSNRRALIWTSISKSGATATLSILEVTDVTGIDSDSLVLDEAPRRANPRDWTLRIDTGSNEAADRTIGVTLLFRGGAPGS